MRRERCAASCGRPIGLLTDGDATSRPYVSLLVGMTLVCAAEPAAPDEADIAARALTVAQRTAFGILGDREEARDVAQDVAVLAVRRRRTLRDPRALDAWLHRIAVRAALREARRNRRRRAAERARATELPVAPAEGLDELLALLEGLPPRQRAALTLRYAHDLPDADIGRALRCRTGTVRSLLSRGRDALRDRLEEEGRA
jgi:RNA polymerase sigma-70 factor (ECF subfamily)